MCRRSLIIFWSRLPRPAHPFGFILLFNVWPLYDVHLSRPTLCLQDTAKTTKKHLSFPAETQRKDYKSGGHINKPHPYWKLLYRQLFYILKHKCYSHLYKACRRTLQLYNITRMYIHTFIYIIYIFNNNFVYISKTLIKLFR